MHQQSSSQSTRPVPWSQLIAYGAGGVIPIALYHVAGQLMGLLGNISLGLSAFWLGTVMVVPRLWDAISDPVIGYLSDNTRSRFGRRRPYLLVGAIAVSFSFVGMWWIPRGDWISTLLPSETALNWLQLIYVLSGLLIFFTACTVFEVPHGALGMEMSSDYHERTRLFSAKSFLGNLFAMGTPWLFYLAGRDFSKGPGGDLTDGMRYVSMLVAAILVPMAFWWFLIVEEPGTAADQTHIKREFWADMHKTLRNGTFLRLVATIFVLAMGFNFVALFSHYITIFYLYDGDTVAAGTLLGVSGTVWGITGLMTVFPLNWISRRVGKNKTLLLAILLMCLAQLTKIVCYSPTHPYLLIIPTVLLSAGMLMFFTLGSSMVGDICDEHFLATGLRSEGSYYAVYWWFIKMGTAFASFVTGALLTFTCFDERQNVTVDSLRGSIEVLRTEAEKWATGGVDSATRRATFNKQIDDLHSSVVVLEDHLQSRTEQYTITAPHSRELVARLNQFTEELSRLQRDDPKWVEAPAQLLESTDVLLEVAAELRRQSPTALFRLRLVEIGLPLVLSVVSISLTLGYPLTEARCYEIKRQIEARRELHGASLQESSE